jgi:hypothetical protein
MLQHLESDRRVNRLTPGTKLGWAVHSRQVAVGRLRNESRNIPVGATSLLGVCLGLPLQLAGLHPVRSMGLELVSGMEVTEAVVITTK